MAQLLDYRGCRVVLYSESGGPLIGESTILKFSQSAYTATITRTAKLSHIPDKVLMRIFHPDGVYECMGSIRRSNDALPEIDLALYHGVVKNDRIATRHPMNRMVTVQREMPDGGVFGEAEVMLIDLSHSGCLMRTAAGSFYPGDLFRIQLPSATGEIMLLATIVRMSPATGGSTDYGCTLGPM